MQPLANGRLSPAPDGTCSFPGVSKSNAQSQQDHLHLSMFPPTSMPISRVLPQSSNVDGSSHNHSLRNARSAVGCVSASIMATSANEPARKAVPRQLDFTSAYGGPLMSSDTVHHSSQPSINHGSPRGPGARSRPTLDGKEGTPKKYKQCNCKNSRCLKLYCECFASGTYCDQCNCVNCCNNAEHELVRQEAVEATLERNPNAFRPKIASSPCKTHGGKMNLFPPVPGAGSFSGRCRRSQRDCCKTQQRLQLQKSGCLKKYCECYQANILCSENCKCMDCRNFINNEERRSLFPGDPLLGLSFVQRPSGSSGVGHMSPLSKKRKTQEVEYSLPMLQENTKSDVVKVENLVVTTPHMPSHTSFEEQVTEPLMKVVHRSLLAGVMHRDVIQELCKLLVIVSAEVQHEVLGVGAVENGLPPALVRKSPHTGPCVSGNEPSPAPGRFQAESTETTMTDDAKHNQSSTLAATQIPTPGAGLNLALDGIQTERMRNERSMSPGTLALMCDEKDPLLTAPSSPSGPTLSGPPLHENQLYVDQERVILSEFRDCLRKITSVGKRRANQFSTEAARAEWMAATKHQSGFSTLGLTPLARPILGPSLELQLQTT